MNLTIIFSLGAVFGSFINALVWRLAKQDGLGSVGQRAKGKGRSKHKPEDYSIVHGRSMCPSCGHTLAARDLVPVLSWLSLHGRCRYCKTAISAQYPLVELLTGIFFVVAYAALQSDTYAWFKLAYVCVYIVFFVALTLYDLKWFLLPDRLVFPLIGLAASQVVLWALLQQSWMVLGEAIFAAAIIFGLFWGIFVLSKGEWIGGGDVKLAVALGLIVGRPMHALLIIFLASLLGTIASLPLLLRSKKKGLMMHIPFGPYLLAACFVVLLAGQRIIDGYQSLFL